MRPALAALLLLAAAPARAASPDGDPSILSVNRSFGVSALTTGIYYVEPSGVDAFKTGANYLDTEDGYLGGAKLAASWMFPGLRDLYVHAEWGGVRGTLAYNGFSQGALIPIYGAASRAVVQDYHAKIGKGIAVGERWMLVPYASLGGRHWERTLGPGSPFVYVESYHHSYAALGSLVQWAPTDGLVTTLDAAVGRTFGANIHSPDSGLRHQPLGASPVIKLGLEGDWRLAGRVHGFLGFDYAYFAYGQSTVVKVPGGFVIEPDSRTQQYDLNVGLRIAR